MLYDLLTYLTDFIRLDITEDQTQQRLVGRGSNGSAESLYAVEKLTFLLFVVDLQNVEAATPRSGFACNTKTYCVLCTNGIKL